MAGGPLAPGRSLSAGGRSHRREETLSPQEFYTLLALIDQTLHGYGIRDQVAHDSHSSVVMATGTTYLLLKRLVAKGWLARVETEDNLRMSGRYELTSLGKAKLQAEARRIQEVAELARYKLSGRAGFLAKRSRLLS